MKVFVQILDTKTSIMQFGMVEEPVPEEFQVLNALKHFGSGNITWVTETDLFNCVHKFGYIDGTSKIVNVDILTK